MAALRRQIDNMVEGEYLIDEKVNRKIWENGAENPPRSIEVEIAEEDDETVVYLAEQETTSQASEQQTTETGDESSDEETDEEYREALEGTVAESKEAVEAMDNPNYDRLLEVEEENKDRKTMKEWLESR